MKIQNCSRFLFYFKKEPLFKPLKSSVLFIFLIVTKLVVTTYPMEKNILKIGVLFAYVQMIAMNALANILPINNRTTGQLSDQLENLFTPQGTTFSIWGLIYLLLLIFAVANLMGATDPQKNRIRKLFIVNTLLNSSWILAWHYESWGLSLLIMLGILSTLILITQVTNDIKPFLERLRWQLPFTVYFGWITVATIANTTAVLVAYEWGGLGISPTNWTVIILFIGLLIGLRQLLRLNQIAYGLVLVWAYAGIYLKHIDPNAFHRAYPSVVNTAGICIGLLLIASLWAGRRMIMRM
jgi:hypothetical protein